MRLCIPVTADRGPQSPANAHFGAAPFFALVDAAGGEPRVVPNLNANHGPGPCNPLVSLEGEAVDAVVVGALGQGAFDKLRARGIRVFLSDAPTVADVLAEWGAGSLREATEGGTCASHGAHAHGHGHPHAH